jgi:fermentation-respiration switch protein FrsA (DUF1100 family)
VLHLGLLLFLIYTLYLAALYFFQSQLLYPRSLAGPARAAGSLPRGVESLWIDAGSAGHPINVEAWFLPPTTKAPAGRAPAVIYFHGNAELIDSRADDLREYRKRGYAVLLPEYRGYGRSGGSPCQRDIVADARRFYDLLAARPDIDPQRIVLHGRSLGAGVAAQVAAAKPACALILESAFTSAASFCWRFGAPPLLCTSPFRTDRVLPRLGRPVLILHGADDDIIPVAHGRRLHAITPGSAYVELAGHHNDFPLDPTAYWTAIDVFLASNGLPASK